MKHKHAELIKAWADGAEIEFWSKGLEKWVADLKPDWLTVCEYRVKPKPKPDVVLYAYSSDYYAYSSDYNGMTHIRLATKAEANLELIYDGDTLKLKGSQVIK